MKKYKQHISFFSACIVFFSLMWNSSARARVERKYRYNFTSAPSEQQSEKQTTTNSGDTGKAEELKYKFKDSYQDPLNFPNTGGLKLNNPGNITTTIEYDPITGTYNIVQKIGDKLYRTPTYMDAEEFSNYELNKFVKGYWKQKNEAENLTSGNTSKVFAPKLNVGGEVFDRIFGGNTIDIRPQGSAELSFGANTSRNKNPALPERQRKITTFDFNENIQLNVVGKIGDKLKISTNYNTQAQFDFENQMKLEFNGYEDDIIKKIEAGNVSLPLTGSLIQGSQSLFGIKTQMQFGKLTATTVFSQQRGKRSEVEVTGGAQISKFEINADMYEDNKHYFLSQYFRNKYNGAMATLPIVSSGINITKVEVWVTNRNGSQDNVRNILALTDLGDTARHTTPTIYADFASATENPQNGNNTLNPQNLTTNFPGIRNINTAVPILLPLGLTDKHFVKLEQARKLSASEFTFNPRLGYISLSQRLQDEVLAVAFQYTFNGQTFQVGEFSTDNIATDSLLIVKMLKGQIMSPRNQSELWDLMMKNVYSIGAYQVNPQDFKLDAVYSNPSTGTDINFLPAPASETNVSGRVLLQTLRMDKINVNGDAQPDGTFDFLDGLTITPNNGRIFLPTIEPFGKDLRSKFIDQNVADQFVFEQLYDSTRVSAQQHPDKNRFKFRGTYKSSSSSEISLNAINIPQGSVNVTAGGMVLQENVDYTVDYTLGRVKIINQGILNSGTPIKVSLESNSLFNIQSKSLFGTRLDYRVNRDFSLGGTILRLNERPITQKVNIGDEPIKNTIWGLDGNYRTEAPFITRFLDKLPLISTKEPSNINVAGEFAHLIPGHSKAIGKEGNSYIDDFEGSQNTIDLRSQFAWSIASTPQNQPLLFPEGSYINDIRYNRNRAKLAWYQLDNLFQIETSNKTPSYYSTTDFNNHLTRQVIEQEVFPNRQNPNNQPQPIQTLDLAYYPEERGAYNYDTSITVNGTLKNPESRWGGIMRRIETNDFEAANIGFVQLWMMDPYNVDNTFNSTTGDLYLNIGNVSEDVLRDSRRSYENGFPNSANITNVDTTSWGRIPIIQPVNKAFELTGREFQDVGLDGFNDDEERSFFNSYLQDIASKYGTTSPAYDLVSSDPSADNYNYYRDDDYDNAQLKTLDRYKKWNGLEGNSPTQEQSDNLNSDKYPTMASANPNEEDINRDNTLNEIENYFQYKISMRPGDLNTVGQNYITDIITANPQGINKPVKWIQFKIPIKEFDSKIGEIEDFRSIRFIRTFLKGFDKPIVLRFARFELVSNQWRVYEKPILSPGEFADPNDATTLFTMSGVNIEENSNRNPVNYVLPPGIERQNNIQSVGQTLLNEQALSLRLCDLKDGEARAVFKNTEYDVRSFKKIEMFVHAESSANDNLKDNELTAFIRLGTDYINNYYEYEIPLQLTPAGTYTNNNQDDQLRVWPDANRLELPFELLQEAKLKRNLAVGQNPNINNQMPYTIIDEDSPEGKNKITIVGNPNLASVKVVMIGVRNPKSADGQAKCGEVWINELRLSEFDKRGGWAANARVNAKLADLGNLSLAGNMSTPFFGSIEKKVSERSRETVKQYDISSSLEVGKLLPDKLGVKIPMYVGVGETIKTPQFNPLDPDIEMKKVLPDLPKAQRDSLKRITEDYTQRRSINFTNVRKEKSPDAKKSHIYDLSNFSATYAFNELYKRNINTEYSSQRSHRVGLTYNYSANPKSIKPFAKISFLKSKHLALVRDFNFSPYPNKYSFTSDIDRAFSEIKNRDITATDFKLPTNYTKTFNWNRNYNLNYDLSKGIKLDYNASNTARIMEPGGRIDTKEKRDSVMDNIKNLGINTSFRQNANVNYTIPINKIPLFDFVTSSVRYSSTYMWTRASFAADSLGNTIQNSNSKQFNAQLNMTTLYNKVPYFKKVLQQKNKEAAKKKEVAKNFNLKEPKDSTDAKKKKEKKKEEESGNFDAFKYVTRFILSIRNVSANYTHNSGTILPGFNDSTQIIGINPQTMAPGFGFVFGSQKDIRPQAGKEGWLIKNPLLNLPYSNTSSKTLNFRANMEPLPSFRVELTANQTRSRNYNEFYRWDNLEQVYKGESPVESGNFSMSYLTIRTAFKKDEKGTYDNEVFQNLLNYRADVSAILAQERNEKTGSTLAKGGDGFYDGYGELSQDVLIPAFMSAYSGKRPTKANTNVFPLIPLPNWKITYDGLQKLEKVKKHFKSFTLSHGYKSTYNVGSYGNNLLFIEDEGKGYSSVRGLVDNNYVPEKIITAVTISEQFSPLLKLDATWNNSLISNIEIKRDRNISLSTGSQLLTETTSREIVIGSGYRIRDITIKQIKIKGKAVKSDMNLKADLSIRRNSTVIRRINEEVSQPQAGQRVININTTADYQLSDKLNIRFFYNRVINNPIVSNTFPSQNTNWGIALRFSLAQ
ncbi:MAG: cell surface protein SprA [Bacteroidetes bacterium]|nr:cell surface protein SprA [Bacteroidota bacterium]